LERIFGIVPVLKDALACMKNHGAMTLHKRRKSSIIVFLSKSAQ
jgi:hypothetical protein